METEKGAPESPSDLRPSIRGAYYHTKQEGLLVGMSDKGIKSRGVVSHSGGQCPQP